jgi:hypothetical protein
MAKAVKICIIFVYIFMDLNLEMAPFVTPHLKAQTSCPKFVSVYFVLLCADTLASMLRPSTYLVKSYVILTPVIFTLFIQKTNWHFTKVEIKHQWIPPRIEYKCCLTYKTKTWKNKPYLCYRVFLYLCMNVHFCMCACM